MLCTEYSVPRYKAPPEQGIFSPARRAYSIASVYQVPFAAAEFFTLYRIGSSERDTYVFPQAEQSLVPR